MDLIKTLRSNKQYVILAGLALGLLYVHEIIPKTIDFFGDNTKWFYTGIMLLAGYAYWRFHWGVDSSSAHFERKVPARDLSNREYLNDVRKQRGEIPKKPMPPTPRGEPRVSEREYSNELRDKFRQN